MIELSDRWDPRARSVPESFWDADSGSWVIREDTLTPRAATLALRLFPHLAERYPLLVETRDAGVLDVRPFDNATPFWQRVDAPVLKALLADDYKALYEFQDIDLGYLHAVLEEHGAAYLGWERGLGKTLGALALIEATEANRALIVAPNTAKGPVWHPEIEKYLPDHDFYILPNPKAQRVRTLKWVEDAINDYRQVVLVIHYEAIDLIDKTNRNGKKIKGGGWKRFGEWDMVAADEAHRIKNPKAKMSRALKKVPTQHKLALSGSIIQNHADELFSPLQWLFPDRYSSRWRDWNDRFLDYLEGGYGKEFVGIKMDRLQEMREELGVFMVYRRKEDELDLPPRTEQELFVDLSPRQRKAYDELVAYCITELEDKTKIAAPEGLAMLTKLRQIATGLDQLALHVQDSTKLDLAMDMILDNPDEPFVVFSWFKQVARSLQNRLNEAGVETALVDGDVKQTERTKRIEAFQAGEGRVFLGTLSTLGESVNLHRANNAIFIDRSWNPAVNVQAADRIYRIGQVNPVTITHIIARGTVDESKVQPTLANKEALRRLILGGA